MKSADIKNQLTHFLDESVHEAFSTTLMIEMARDESVEVLEPPDGIICSMGFAGMLEGAFAMTLSNEMACKVVSKMLDIEITELSNDVIDGISEVLNMVGGGVKTRMAVLNYDLDLSMPTTIMGQDLKIASSNDNTEISAGFSCEGLKFSMIVIFKINLIVEQPVQTPPAEESEQKDALIKQADSSDDTGKEASPSADKEENEMSSKDVSSALNSLISTTNEETGDEAESPPEESKTPSKILDSGNNGSTNESEPPQASEEGDPVADKPIREGEEQLQPSQDHDSTFDVTSKISTQIQEAKDKVFREKEALKSSAAADNLMAMIQANHVDAETGQEPEKNASEEEALALPAEDIQGTGGPSNNMPSEGSVENPDEVLEKETPPAGDVLAGSEEQESINTVREDVKHTLSKLDSFLENMRKTKESQSQKK